MCCAAGLLFWLLFCFIVVLLHCLVYCCVALLCCFIVSMGCVGMSGCCACRVFILCSVVLPVCVDMYGDVPTDWVVIFYCVGLVCCAMLLQCCVVVLYRVMM